MSVSRYKYPLALFDNARHFVESAVQYARDKDPRSWKFAIVHVTTALELLAKARIAFENPHEIVQGHVDDLRFERGDFRSINIDEAFKRLRKETGLSLSTRHRTALDCLKAARNRFVHFTDTATSEETRALVASGLDLFFHIHEVEFADMDDPLGSRSMTDLAHDLSEFHDFVVCRLASISDRLKTLERPRTLHISECQRCLQEADIISGDDIVCLFCGYRLSIRDWTELLSDDHSVEDCPVCHRPSVATHQTKKGREATHECFCCGYFRGPEIKWVDGEGRQVPRLRDA